MRETLWSATVRGYWILARVVIGVVVLFILAIKDPRFLISRMIPIGIALALVFNWWRKRRVRPLSDGSKGHWTLGSSFEDVRKLEGKPDYVRQGYFLTHGYKATNGIRDEVHYSEGRVVAYSNFGRSLSVRMHDELKPGTSAPIGSTLKEVLSAYGTPLKVLAHGQKGAPLDCVIYGSKLWVLFDECGRVYLVE